MVRKTIIALAAAAMAAMLTIPTTDALARGGGHGGGGFRAGGLHGGFGGFRGGGVRFGSVGAFRGGFHRGFFPRNRVFVRRAPFFGYGLYASSCWRWVPTGYGLRRVWVCGRPYAYY